jgi:two-component system alkaline phosphatase synthesis response regulator PhoP
MPDPARQPRILIADDNIEGVELLEAYLAGTDYETQIAYDGEETLRKIKDWHPDVVLLDIMMPKISGFRCANGCGRIPRRPTS